MAYSNRYNNNNSQSYAPSAPSFPGEQSPYTSASAAPNYHAHHSQSYPHGTTTPSSSISAYGSYGQQYPSSSSLSEFPAGTHPDVIRSFQLVDRDRSGFIDENELQQALSSTYNRFSLRTIRLLIFLFKNPNAPLTIGPKEFAALWTCLGQWQAIFQRYDKDRSGKIDSFELRDALYGIGYTIPASILQLLVSKYDDGSGRRVELNFDSFVECGLIVKGLTDKFKEKDRRYTGSATLSYDTFMSMVIPFLVSYN
ncbi:hypothetical protein CMV_003897 [Castanea mollissima]|uniref:EF-hand domain-containing protein n=1 Tax=Castanea mollissima TaxID=60419 RepID=A0A8J4RSN1_9ROSI|nr:hypothetical protein CMV_003897 [Castanea mollissima]